MNVSKREEIENTPFPGVSNTDWRKILETYFQERLKGYRLVLGVYASGYHAHELSVFTRVNVVDSHDQAMKKAKSSLRNSITEDLSWIDDLDIETIMEELEVEEYPDDETDIRSKYKQNLLKDIKTMDLDTLQNINNMCVLDNKLDLHVDSVVVMPLDKTSKASFDGYGLVD